jgi:hypothetical protein
LAHGRCAPIGTRPVCSPIPKLRLPVNTDSWYYRFCQSAPIGSACCADAHKLRPRYQTWIPLSLANPSVTTAPLPTRTYTPASHHRLDGDADAAHPITQLILNARAW